MADDEALVRRVEQQRRQWEGETAEIRAMLREKESKLAVYDRRRRLLSLQHEVGGLTDDEYLERLRVMKREEEEFKEQLGYLRRFTTADEPPSPQQIRKALATISTNWERAFCKLAKIVPLLPLALAKDNKQQELLQQLLDQLDVKIIVCAGNKKQRFRLNIFTNIPIKNQEVGDRVMMSPLSS